MENYFRKQYFHLGFLFVCFTLASAVSLADTSSSVPSLPWYKNWTPFISFGGGSFNTSDIGESQYFPITDPIVEEYYQYQPHSSSQTRGLFDVFLGTEWTLSPWWALQTGLDYSKTGTFHVDGTFVEGADPHSEDTFGYQYKFTTQQLFAETKLLFGNGHFRPYITAGIGGAANAANDYSTTVPPFLTFTREYGDNTNIAFAYNVGAGIDFALDSHLRVGVGYRFASLGKVSLGNANIDDVAVSGTLSQDKLYSNEFLAQLTFVI